MHRNVYLNTYIPNYKKSKKPTACYLSPPSLTNYSRNLSIHSEINIHTFLSEG